MQRVGVGHAESVALDAVLNVGGFGQTDEQFVIQSESLAWPSCWQAIALSWLS